MQHLCVRITGGAIVTILILVLVVLSGLALVWLLVSPGVAVGIGAGLILLVRGVIALLTPG